MYLSAITYQPEKLKFTGNTVQTQTGVLFAYILMLKSILRPVIRRLEQLYIYTIL